ncbi:MAG: molybdopterin-dependent oxidoreductase, partial [Rhodanobacteraceae bacterium]
MKVTRRKFLVGSGAALGGIALGGLVSAQKYGNMQGSLPDFNTYTRLHVAHWGAFYAEVQGGRLVRAVPFKDDVQPSAMTQGTPDLLYSPSRIRYPMVRKGFYQNREKSDTSGRGAEPFVRVSWDEATGMVAEQLQRVKDQYGNTAIYGGSYGWDSAGRLHTSVGALQRLLALFGGYVFGVNTYSAPVMPVIMPHVVGASSPASSTWPTIIDNTKLLVAFGYNPLTHSQVIYGGDGSHFDYAYFQQLKAAGIPMVSINPLVTDTDQYFNTERIAIRPNTDTALMLALAHVLYTEKLHDQAFMDKYTTGFDKFADYLTGKSDGQPKSPEWAAPITDVDADTIRKLARRMAGTRSALMGGYTLQRASHGAEPVWMMVTLAAMLGQIGKPGGGVQLNYPGGMGVPSGMAPGVPGLGGVENPVPDFVPINMWTDLLLNPGKVLDYDGQKLTYPDIKMVMWAGGNPFHHGHDVNRVVKAWQRPEVTVVADYNWTASAKHADIVLPATTTLERNDITSSSHYVLAMKKAVDPIFEARDDFDFFADLADRLGLGDQYTEGKGEMDWLRQMYGVAEKAGTARGLDMPDFDTFWEREYLSFDDDPNRYNTVAYSDFIENPAANPLGTPSGKFEIYSEKIASFNYDDCPPHPAWLEPFEWLGSEKAKTYPLHVMSDHPKYRLHSQLDNLFIHDWYEISQREPMWINPKDAAARGLQT